MGQSTLLAEKNHFVRGMWGWLWPVLLGVAVTQFVVHFMFQPAQVPSWSMYPTIPVPPPPNTRPSYILVDHLATEFGHVYRGEVVVFIYPDDGKTEFVKRVIGLPGDTVSISGGHVYVNHRLLREPYLRTVWGQTDGTFGPFHVPKDHYFMLGDDRNASHDSRFWNHPYVPRSSILGRADLVLWPISQIGTITATVKQHQFQ